MASTGRNIRVCLEKCEVLPHRVVQQQRRHNSEEVIDNLELLPVTYLFFNQTVNDLIDCAPDRQVDWREAGRLTDRQTVELQRNPSPPAAGCCSASGAMKD